MTDPKPKNSYSRWDGAGHVPKTPTAPLKDGEEAYTIADIEQVFGLSGNYKVKQWAESQGLLKVGRYTIPGRHKIKRMNYVDRAGLEAILLNFRAVQGAKELDVIERECERMENRRLLGSFRGVRKLVEGTE